MCYKMTRPIIKPEIPYNGKIPEGLAAGRMCRIQGVSHPEADRFNINLQTGPSADPHDNTALHMSIRHNQGYIARNSYIDGEWGKEMGDLDNPIGLTESFEILILVDEKDYKIAINGQHFSEFPHRIPISEVNYLLIDGDVTITLISWEGIMGLAGGENVTKESQSSTQEGMQFGQGGYAPPSQGYGAPPQGYGAPPQGYGAPPQGYGGYGVPNQGYGAPPQGYGPPLPPGAEPQGGGFDFLDSAQSLLAGAIKSGAAANILKGFMSSGSQPQGQGYSPHNAKYGIYPELPQDMNLNLTSNKPEQGPVEKLLSSFLSGSTNQQTPGTNPQGQQNQQVDIGALLSNLLSSNQGNQTSTQQTNLPGNQTAPGTNQGGDIGSLLSSLLSSHQPNQTPTQQGTTQANPTGTQQGGDIGSFLSTLLSGTNQEKPGAPTQQGSIDIQNLLSGILSGTATRPLQENTGTGTQPPNPTSTQSQGPDIGTLLSGLLSGGSHQNPTPGGYQNPSGGYQNPSGGYQNPSGGYQNPSGGYQNPSGGYQNPSGGYQNPSGPQQNQGIDLGSLLSGLMSSTGGNQQPQSRPNDPSRNFPPKTSGNDHTTRVKEAKPEDKFEDVSDQLEREMSRDGTRQQLHSSQGDEQYGHYPQPPQEQKGPLENLLSGLLSGGQQPAQQQRPPQFGGGQSVGGLGSMSGILENFAGSLLHPREQNPRQNY